MTVALGIIIGGNCHKYHFCPDKRRLLSRQKYACRNKSFVATKSCLLRQNIFVTTNICHNKHNFVATTFLLWQTRVCRDKTRLLSWQNYVSIIFVATNNFAMTKVLSRQKTCFVMTNTCLSRQTRVCHDKTFVATKWYLWQLLPMIRYSLLPAPSPHRPQPPSHTLLLGSHQSVSAFTFLGTTRCQTTNTDVPPSQY